MPACGPDTISLPRQKLIHALRDYVRVGGLCGVSSVVLRASVDKPSIDPTPPRSHIRTRGGEHRAAGRGADGRGWRRQPQSLQVVVHADHGKQLLFHGRCVDGWDVGNSQIPGRRWIRVLFLSAITHSRTHPGSSRGCPLQRRSGRCGSRCRQSAAALSSPPPPPPSGPAPRSRPSPPAPPGGSRSPP